MPHNSDIHRFFHKKERDVDYLAERVMELREDLKSANPQTLATHTGATYTPIDEERGEFRLPLWGQEIVLAFPEFSATYLQTGKPLDSFNLALLAYYFSIADGTPASWRFIAFSELPDGKFYAQAFQGYSGDELLKIFGDDVEAFATAAAKVDGRPEPLGDRAFSFQVLPQVALVAVCWLGDEDFPSSYRILFDAAASHHLSTDACAVVGSTLTRRLIKAHTPN